MRSQSLEPRLVSGPTDAAASSPTETTWTRLSLSYVSRPLCHHHQPGQPDPLRPLRLASCHRHPPCSSKRQQKKIKRGDDDVTFVHNLK